MNTLMLLSVAFFTVHASITEEWLNFKEQYGKVYRTREEENIRYNIFRKNLQKIEDHNKNFNNGKSSFKMAVNKFADLTTDEFKKMLGYNHESKSYLGARKQYLALKSDPEPESLDWRDKGAVTEVKDQSSCGAALAFSIAGAIESQYFIKTGNLISLSANMLADCACCTISEEHIMSLHQQTEINCTKIDTCSSSLGGWQDDALEWSKKYGVMADKDYPYTPCGGDCHFNESNVITKISSYVRVAQNDEHELKNAVVITPTSVVIDVTQNFQFYISGIFDDKMCSANNLNHGVLIVGYGSLNGNDYWIVKNSWGSAWGDQGYILMSRNKNNQCGIASDAVYPLI